MARIRLYPRQSLITPAETVCDDQGGSVLLPFFRVYSLAYLGIKARALAECIVDTGAPLTVIPRDVWKKCERDIEWLRTTDRDMGQAWVTRLRGRTGGSSACRVGRITIQAFDLGPPPQFLTSRRIVAQFEEGTGYGDQVIVGLRHSILEGRRLIVEPNLENAWLEDL